MEHNLCSCGKSQVQPGDGSTIVVGTVGSLWLRLTVLLASKLPRSRKDKLGHEEISSLHTFGSSVSAKTDLAAATAFFFLWIFSPLTLTGWANLAWSACVMFGYQASKTQGGCFCTDYGIPCGCDSRGTQEGAMQEGRASQCSANDQFDCGQYSALMLFKLLPGPELFYVGHLTLLTPDMWFPLVIIEANKTTHTVHFRMNGENGTLTNEI